MAIRVDDALSKVLHETAYSKRFDNWLWFYLDSCGARFNSDYFHGPNMRAIMADYIAGRQEIVDDIKHYSSLDLLPIEMFEWIKEDERQCQWLVSLLKKEPDNWLGRPPIRLRNRDLVIAMIDTQRVDLSRKQSTVDRMKDSWSQHIENDGVLLWFKGKEEELKCELAWKWITAGNGGRYTRYSEQIRSHQELLMCFDRMEFSDDKKLLCLNSVKKSWSQRRYRKNLTGKKQYNFILSDPAIKRLDGLAKKYELKRTQVLEILLKMESEHETYMPEVVKFYREIER